MRTGAALGARLWWGLPLLIVLLWSVGMLTVATIPGLPVPPAITQVGLPITRFARDVAAMITVGTLIVGGLLTERPHPRLLRWAAGWSVAWLVSLAVLLTLTLSDIRAVAVTEVLDLTTLWPLLLHEALGHVFALQGLAVACVLLLALASRGRRAVWVAVLLAIAASSAPAFLGHADAVHSHAAATASLALHVGAVSVWVGGLAALVGLVLLDATAAREAIGRFSLVALVCVVIVAESGLLNASLRVGSPSAFVSTPYGALVLGKVTLLGVLVWAGWAQRRRAVPDAATDPSASLLVRLAAWESVVMGAAIAVSITLSRLGPGPTAGSPDGTFLALSVVLLSLAVGLLLAWAIPPSADRGWVRRVRSAPEVPAIVLLVVVIEVSGVGLPAFLLGPQGAAVVGSLLLMGAGWWWAVAAWDARGVPSIIILMVGWPLALWATVLLTGTGGPTRLDLLSVLLAEGLLGVALWRARKHPAPVPGRSVSAVVGG